MLARSMAAAAGAVDGPIMAAAVGAVTVPAVGAVVGGCPNAAATAVQRGSRAVHAAVAVGGVPPQTLLLVPVGAAKFAYGFDRHGRA